MNLVNNSLTTTIITCFPPEVTTKILSCLHPKDLLIASKVCREWDEIIKSKSNEKNFWAPYVNRLITLFTQNLPRPFSELIKIPAQPCTEPFAKAFLLKCVINKALIYATVCLEAANAEAYIKIIQVELAFLKAKLSSATNLATLCKSILAKIPENSSKTVFLSNLKILLLTHKILTDDFEFLRVDDDHICSYFKIMNFIENSKMEEALNEFQTVSVHRNETLVCMDYFIQTAIKNKDLTLIKKVIAWHAKEEFNPNQIHTFLITNLRANKTIFPPISCYQLHQFMMLDEEVAPAIQSQKLLNCLETALKKEGLEKQAKELLSITSA